jgi:hypothetical protein
MHGNKRSEWKFVVGKTPPGRPRHRRKDNIKINLIVMRW